jgi:hypothetical protein
MPISRRDGQAEEQQQQQEQLPVGRGEDHRQQRADGRPVTAVRQLVDFQPGWGWAGARHVQVQDNIGCRRNLIRPGHRSS